MFVWVVYLTVFTFSGSSMPDGSIRLVGGPRASRGRVEIYHKGVWGTVCDDTWGKNEARVVCRQLGYTDGIPFKRAYYGQGSGRIWMDDVVCTGLESALRNCRFPGWGEKNCDHTEDAGVFCYGPQGSTQATGVFSEKTDSPLKATTSFNDSESDLNVFAIFTACSIALALVIVAITLVIARRNGCRIERRHNIRNQRPMPPIIRSWDSEQARAATRTNDRPDPEPPVCNMIYSSAEQRGVVVHGQLDDAPPSYASAITQPQFIPLNDNGDVSYQSRRCLSV